jgi:hypothetical protein
MREYFLSADQFIALSCDLADRLMQYAGHNIFHEKEGEVTFKPDIKLLKGATPPEQNVIPFRIGAISGDADE